MALRKLSEESVKITTVVFKDDWLWLKETYSKNGASKAFRAILRAHRQATEKKIEARKAGIDAPIDIDL